MVGRVAVTPVEEAQSTRTGGSTGVACETRWADYNETSWKMLQPVFIKDPLLLPLKSKRITM